MLPDIDHYHTIQSELTEKRIVPFLEDHINYQEADFLNSQMNVSNPDLFDWNKRTAVKLYNMMSLLKNQNQFLNRYYIKAGEKVRMKLCSYCKQEYHLK